MGDFNFDINPSALLESLKYMGLGMLCIFAVTAVIILAIYGLQKLLSPKKDTKED